MKKTKISRKLLQILPILLIFSFVGVIAGVAEYYAQIDVQVDIDQPITVNGKVIPYTEPMSMTCTAGEFCVDDEVLSVENSNDVDKDITITTTDCEEADIYIVNKLEMFTKDVNWTETTDLTATVVYTFVGEELHYMVETEDNLDEYVVVYYPDLDGNPGSWNIANAIKVGDVTDEWTMSTINEDLPISTDFNEAGKLWLIPSADWDTPAWNPSVWLFEHNLIKHYQNSNGIVTVPAAGSLEFYLAFDVDEMAYDTCNTVLTINTI